MDVVTKSGTNQFHGARLRVLPEREAERDALGAARRHRAPRTRSNRNQFGAAFGGPIRKDKTFFFVELLGPAPGGDLLPEHARSSRPRSSARATSRSPRSSPGIPATGQPFPGGIIPAARFDPAALTIQDRFVPASNLPNNFFEVQPARPAQHRRGDAQAGPPPRRRATSLALSYFYQKGTDTQPLSLTGNIPWVDRDFKWSQHNVNLADTWTAELDHDQPAPRHLRAAVRRPREQPDDLARRPELEVHDPGRPHAAAADASPATSPARPRSRVPTRAATTSGCKDMLSISARQPLVQVRRGGLVREDRPRHAARQLRRLRVQRQQDRQRLRRLPARPAQHDDAGRAGAEDRQRLAT